MSGIVVTDTNPDPNEFNNFFQQLFDNDCRQKIFDEFLIKLPSMVKSYLTTGYYSAFGLPVADMYKFNVAAYKMSTRLKIYGFYYNEIQMATLKKTIQDRYQITDDEYHKMRICIVKYVKQICE